MNNPRRMNDLKYFHFGLLHSCRNHGHFLLPRRICGGNCKIGRNRCLQSPPQRKRYGFQFEFYLLQITILLLTKLFLPRSMYRFLLTLLKLAKVSIIYNDFYWPHFPAVSFLILAKKENVPFSFSLCRLKKSLKI